MKIMKTGKLLLMVLGLVTVVAGCAEVDGESTQSQDEFAGTQEAKVVNLPSEITLYPESTLTGSTDEIVPKRFVYEFSGFSSDDRLVFEKQMGSNYSLSFATVYHPAKVGYTFKLKNFSENTFEIIEVNPEKNYVKLKVLDAEGK